MSRREAPDDDDQGVQVRRQSSRTRAEGIFDKRRWDRLSDLERLQAVEIRALQEGRLVPDILLEHHGGYMKR